MKKVYLIMTLVCMMMVSCKPDSGNGKHRGHEYVDLGLSIKWATCNVGSNSPEEYGLYFAWGETSPKSEYYIEDNCITYGKKMNDIAGDAEYDAARANWGGDWRMPTRAEFNELRSNCTWTWTAQNDVNGYNVEGPNGNSIFLPAAGGRYWLYFDYVGSRGDYWCSTPYEEGNNDAYYLFFNGECNYMEYYYGRHRGYSVRPVLE